MLQNQGEFKHNGSNVHWKINFDPNQLFGCTHCGDCCNKTSVKLFARDRQSFPKQLTDEIMLGDGKAFIIKGTNQGRCPLNEDSKCTKYQDRPFFCREFPLNIIKISENNVEVDLQYACPGLFTNKGTPFDEAFLEDLIQVKLSFSEFAKLNLPLPPRLEVSLKPEEFYKTYSIENVLDLIERLKHQVNQESPLTGFDMEQRKFYHIHFDEKLIVFSKDNEQVHLYFDAGEPPFLQPNNILVKYLQNLWTRLSTRIELGGLPHDEITLVKLLLETKVFELCFGIAIIIAKIKGVHEIDNTLSAETIFMLDNIILESLSELKKNL